IAGRAMERFGRRTAAGVFISLQRPLPAPLRDVNFLNQLAFHRHRSRAYPGRATLILSEEHRALYAPDPVADWKALAREGYDVHFVPGEDAEMFREPGVTVLARHLAATLSPAQRR